MKRLTYLIVAMAIIATIAYHYWPGIINRMLPLDSRPTPVPFECDTPSDQEYDALLLELTTCQTADYQHVERFRSSDIRTYRGPSTCLGCHEKLRVEMADGSGTRQVDLMDNLTGSAHYRLFTERHPNVYGFNGELADNFAMGKINRPCPKPGSFAMSAWAEIVITNHGDSMSEGCGQCHIGGQYQAPLGEMMPGYRTTASELNAIDCLICHSAEYDMNAKVVVIDRDGRKRWGQDRSLRAAMTVTRPTSQSCLRCHQHNFGGDLYIESAHPEYMPSLNRIGAGRPRIAHPGSKRGTPFTPDWDVHAAIGMDCIDCHITQGHLIARGTHTTTVMANDLPGTDIACENCHGQAPHPAEIEMYDRYNSHTSRIACQTCHIPSLHPDNATMRDFSTTVLLENEGIYLYNDSVKAITPETGGIVYRWWNGDGTFLGNPVGDNPNGKGLYQFYTADYRWPEFSDFDYDSWYERVMRPIARKGRPSKLYAMKRFQGKQHIDLGNITPFGGMFVPYNLPEYYLSGDPEKALVAEMDKSMIKMMYGALFKYYMLDKFMSFMSSESWDIDSYEKVKHLKNVEPRWIPNEASIEISHAIRRKGALTCEKCHSRNGVLDFVALGYTPQEVERLISISGN